MNFKKSPVHWLVHFIFWPAIHANRKLLTTTWVLESKHNFISIWALKVKYNIKTWILAKVILLDTFFITLKDCQIRRKWSTPLDYCKFWSTLFPKKTLNFSKMIFSSWRFLQKANKRIQFTTMGFVFVHFWRKLKTT